MNTIVGSIEGSLLYNKDNKKVYLFNGTNWVQNNNDNWLLNGNVGAYGSFLGTTDDVAMDIRSNNTSILQFGRRQTLGLVQSYPDYTDPGQYITYVRDNNGISALQFQADAASFYKPMFFTNAIGNFRLKGSAAGTDFFEMGSAGTSNNGEFEFIIGDDGAEPFTFKRYDYRDQLLKELMRIQGSSDAQDAKPRVGIGTSALANSTLQVNGSLATAIVAPSSNLTLDESHHTVIINSNITITLPAANSANGRIYVLKNTTNTAKTISAYLDHTGNNATQIGSQTTLWLQSNGSSWNAISSVGQEVVTNLSQNTTSGNISYVNESNTTQTARVVSANANNIIKVGTDGGAYLKINMGGRWTNSDTSTDLNVDNTNAPIFGNENYKDDGNNLYQVSGNTLIVKEAGRYDIRANLSLLGVNSGGSAEQRTNVNARISVNGTPVGALGASGYIRWAGNHEQSSVHVSEILNLNANDVITIRTYREANSGVVNFSGANESSIMINKLK
ncbi:MAG: hypothetical protein E4H26_06650 [Flavobacteriales bacterium]|nr:MAG: hypothetical protein E4H26_06650 [Flavobacteriales bacterium]